MSRREVSTPSFLGFHNPFRGSSVSRRRNPRYAPEGLERRVGPSHLGLTSSAQVCRWDDGPLEPPPPDGDGSVPPIEPTVPSGPSGPA